MSTHALMNMKSQSSIQIQQKERCRDGCRISLLIAGGCSCSTHFSYFTTILPSLHHHSFCRNDFFHFLIVLSYLVVSVISFPLFHSKQNSAENLEPAHTEISLQESLLLVRKILWIGEWPHIKMLIYCLGLISVACKYILLSWQWLWQVKHVIVLCTI